MTLQEQFWSLLVEQKAQSLYVAHYHMHTENIDRWLNILTAVASSSSIAGWAIWQQHAFLWGLIIAASQVINAIKQHLPYQRRLSALSGYSHDLARLVISIEHDWFDVAEARLTAGQVQKKLTGYRKQVVQLTRKHFDKHSLPRKPDLLSLAEREAMAYFKANYGFDRTDG